MRQLMPVPREKIFSWFSPNPETAGESADSESSLPSEDCRR